MLARLAEISCPALVVVGAEDVADMLSIAAQVASTIPGARLEIVPGAGQLPTLERPDVLNRLLLDFVGP